MLRIFSRTSSLTPFCPDSALDTVTVLTPTLSAISANFTAFAIILYSLSLFFYTFPDKSSIILPYWISKNRLSRHVTALILHLDQVDQPAAVVSPQRCHQQSCLHQHVAAKDFPGLLDAILFLRCQAFQTYSPAVEVRSGKYLYIGYQRFFLILGCHLIAVIITVFQK